MSEAAIDAAIAAMPLPSGPSVVETGCGRAEILVRTVRAHGAVRGLGVDLDADAIAEARDRAADLPVRFEVLDAGAIDGRFDAVINVASSHAHGGFPRVFDALRAFAPVALYGEGFWRHPPSYDFLNALGGARADELDELDGLRAATGNAGFEIVHESLACEDDWQRYEEMLAANAERHGTEETLAYAQQIRDRRALPDGANTLGFALFVLRLKRRGPLEGVS
jgi:hypothetical protein